MFRSIMTKVAPYSTVPAHVIYFSLPVIAILHVIWLLLLPFVLPSSFPTLFYFIHSFLPLLPTFFLPSFLPPSSFYISNHPLFLPFLLRFFFLSSVLSVGSHVGVHEMSLKFFKNLFSKLWWTFKRISRTWKSVA